MLPIVRYSITKNILKNGVRKNCTALLQQNVHIKNGKYNNKLKR